MIARRALLMVVVALVLGCSRRTPPAPSGVGPRLAVLNPAMSVILRDLGRDNLIVARHAFDLVLPDSMPIVGDQHTIDYERLVTLAPTHILLQTGATDVPPKLRELAAAHRWEVVTLPLLTLDDVRAALAKLDELTGGPSDRGRELRARFDGAMAARPEVAERLGRVLCLAWTDPPGVMGPGSFHAQIIESLGATSVPAEGSPYIEWSNEDVVRTDPDTLILLRPGSEDDLETALGPLARMNLRCVLEDRVIVVRDLLCHTPSTALSGVAEFIVAQTSSWPARIP